MSSPKAGEAKVSRHDELPGKKFQPASASFSDPKSLVTFIFGPGDKTMELIVHKEVACHYFEVLNAAFNSSFIEGSTQTYRIKNFREVTFTCMDQWLYSQRFNLLHHDPAFDCKISMDKDFSQFQELLSYLISLPNLGFQPPVQLWVLADLLAIPKLQNAAIDALQSVTEESDLGIEDLRSCCFRYIYKNSMNESQLRKYILAPFVRRTVDPDTIKDDAKVYPHAMLVDVSEMYISMNVNKDGLEDMNATEFYVDVHDA
ncbi:hypothetical protein WAI453_007114 [Rhynchosporium graminicola]